MNRKNETVRSVVLGTVRRQPLLCTALVLAVAGAVAASLLPPLVLGRVVDRLTARQAVPFALALGYFGLLALSGGLDSLRESLLTVFGQRMTHALRSAMCAKLDKLPAEAFVNQESGAAVSRFVGDVDTVEELFTSGIISMFADACRLCGILAVIFAENRGLALILLVVLPLLYLFTRVVQKRMLKAQLQNRAARTVGLHDAIAALPEGYDTPCTPGIFSQGQWQLLSIARAIAAGPQILLLDEITANLDAGTEQTVLDALQHAGQNRTVVSISHRLYNRTGGRSIEI